MKKSFGQIDGKEVSLVVLDNGHLQVEIIEYGATIRALRVPDRYGDMVDVCLGYDTLEAYLENDAFFGATVGRYAGRIGKAAFEIDGKVFHVGANDGENSMHGGNRGFNTKLWKAEEDGVSATLSYLSPDGEEGFPGDLDTRVTFSLVDDALVIEYRAKSTADTPVSLTNHSYFNLAGDDGGRVRDHVLVVRADRYTPVDEHFIPTGDYAAVDGTPLDFRAGHALEESLTHPFFAKTCGPEANYVLNEGDPFAARLTCPRTGIGLEVSTTMEALYIYATGELPEIPEMIGKRGNLYGRHHAMCFETQRIPDAMNHPGFPTPIVRAGEEYKEKTVFRFFKA